MIKTRKAQEEIVGFVLIVVIVSVMIVIFLGFSIRNNNAPAQESKDVYRFLESSMQYTTDCAISYEPAYLNLGDLIRECYKDASLCISEKQPCAVAKETLKALIDSAFPQISPESSIKGYEYKSIYLRENASQEEIIFLSKGNCSQSIRGAEVLIPSYPGTISNSLNLCY